MRNKTRPQLRSIGRNQFRDNTVISQGDTYVYLPARPIQAAPALTHVIPYPRNEDFIRRPEIVDKLDKLLPQSSDFHSAALCGLGGSGKTQIALDYVYRRGGTHSVFWVHADTRATIVHDYKMIAAKFGNIDSGLGDEELLMAVRNRIEAEPEWLLVLDNADDLSLFGVGMVSNLSESLTDFIPGGPKGLILWTSRDKHIAGTLVGAARALEVDDMSLGEAKKLLSLAAATTQDKTTSEDMENVNKLLESLQYHALAISQAGAYMRRTSTSVHEYMNMFTQKRKRQTLLGKSEFDRHRKPGAPNSILETWSISIDQIRQESELAFKIFHIIAFFDNQKFPRPLVDLAGIESGYDWEEETDELEDAITRLKDFSLIYQRGKEYHQMYEMHKLVQEAARYRLRTKKPSKEGPTTIISSDVLLENEGDSEERDESFFALSALNVLAFICGDLHEDEETLLLGGDYQAHALQVVGWMELCGESVETTNKLSAISDLLGDLEEWKDKQLLDERILTMRQKILGERHPDTLKSMAALTISYLGQASMYRDEATNRFIFSPQYSHTQPDTDKALRLGVKVLRLRRLVLGPNHRDTIASGETVAEVYCGKGLHQFSTRIAKEISERLRTLYGKMHPRTLAAMEDLAYVYYERGWHKKALRIRQRVLERQRMVAKRLNLGTLQAMHNVAISGYKCGMHHEALALMKECDTLRGNVLGPFHRYVLGCYCQRVVWEEELMKSDEKFGNDKEFESVEKPEMTEKLESDEQMTGWTMV